jgi:hypothetical protein
VQVEALGDGDDRQQIAGRVLQDDGLRGGLGRPAGGVGLGRGVLGGRVLEHVEAGVAAVEVLDHRGGAGGGELGVMLAGPDVAAVRGIEDRLVVVGSAHAVVLVVGAASGHPALRDP